MPSIEFKGKTYRSEFEMPPEVREAYNRDKEGRAEQTNTTSRPLTDIVDMSPEVREIYERALGNVDEKLASSERSRGLPRTEDLYRQSAPDDMKHLPSDESIYRPSQPLIDPGKSVIEPESAFGMSRFVASILWVFILLAVAFVIMQFLR